MQTLGNDDNTCTGAPSTLCFPRADYNMLATPCQLEDISDTLDPKTNEHLHEAKRILHVALEQQAESFASQCLATLSRMSQPMTTTNRDRSDAHAPPMGKSSGDSSSSSSGCPRTTSTKPR
jgi:hypothetical protein